MTLRSFTPWLVSCLLFSVASKKVFIRMHLPRAASLIVLCPVSSCTLLRQVTGGVHDRIAWRIVINRRRWLYGAGILVGATGLSPLAQQNQNPTSGQSTSPTSSQSTSPTSSATPLPLSQYEPTSMLHVRETRVERARYAAIDIHTHISVSKKSEKGVAVAAERQFLGTPD